MLAPKANSKQKRVKIVDYEENGSHKAPNILQAKSWHDFMTRKHPTFCKQNRDTVAKSCHVFYSIRSKNSF